MATRRTTSTRHGQSTKPTAISAEKLAEQFSTKLTISSQKGKQKVCAALSDEEVRSSAMRSVNSASQELSAIVHSGWKRTSDVPTSQQYQRLKDITTFIVVINKGLADLRQISPGSVDVERAAVSVLGKLIALEMHDEAMSALEDLHPRLRSLLNSSTKTTKTRLRLMSIPIPIAREQPLDPILLTLTSNYLAYALSVLSATCFTPVRTTKETLSTVDDFSTALDTESTLLTWVPLLSSLPGKQMDSALTRVYTSLVRSCATCTNNPRAVFVTRFYALRCLAHTTNGTIEPGHLWDQATKFGGAFTKSQPSSDEEAMKCILSAYGDIIDRIEKRDDRETFMSGKGFVRFSEYWMAFAKKVGNIPVLNRIGGLMRRTSLHPPCSRGVASSVAPQGYIKEERIQTAESMMQEGYRICAFLAQTTLSLEQGGSDSVQRVKEMTTLLKDCHSFIQKLKLHDVSEDETRRINVKLDRALEQTRRATIVFLESHQSVLTDDSKSAIRLLIEEVLRIWLLPGGSASDSITRSLETLFALARIVLSPVDPRSYPDAHKYLTQAVTIVETSKSEASIDTANFIRCISGAFHNAAGVLYQAGRCGAAIGFLQDACSLGMRAMSTPRIATLNNAKDKTDEGWRQLDEQLYRRWELLGVCYSKIGDRKQAFEALCHCVTSFPYTKSGFSERIEECTLTGLFNTSSDAKQLGILIDRLSYLAACELLKEAKLVSLASLKLDNSRIIGALLERQVESLEPHRRKAGVQVIIVRLLSDALSIYKQDMPIRRARVLLKCLDVAYHAGPEALVNMGPPDEIGLEIEKLLGSDKLGKDNQLVRLRSQYQASAHLWLALHAHRRVDMEQSMLIKLHSHAACKILKGFVDPSNHKVARKSSPRQVLPSKNILGPPLPRPRSKRVALSQKNEPATPKSKPRKGQYSTAKTPPRLTGPVKTVPLDDFESLLVLLQLTARITGLLALTILKVHILDIIRKLCDQQMGSTSNGYVIASIDLAHEYAKLGKVRRASTIFNQILVLIRSGEVSEEACVLYFLRFAELLALTENADHSIAIYCEALSLSKNLEVEDKTMSTTQRVHIRVRQLERAAIASRVYSLIRYLKEDTPTSLHGTLQSLRLWNRAVDNLTRLNLPPATPSNSTTECNPFQVASEKESMRSPEDPSKETVLSGRLPARWPSLGALEWRMAEGLLETLFSLSHLYFSWGSSREAEYFAQQAQNLAESLNAPAMVSRALARVGEVQLYQGLLDRSFGTLTKASETLWNSLGFESAEICRLRGVYNERTSQRTGAMELYQETIDIIKTLDQTFNTFDGLAFGPESSSSNGDVVLPELLAAVLRQKIWLLRDHDTKDYTPLLDRFLSLPNSTRTKSEENALMAKLTLHAVYKRLHSDMFLCSVAESTIALPIGMSSKLEHISSPSVYDVLATLDKAAQLYWANLFLIAHKGSVHEVRETVISLALVQAFQTSLGKPGNSGSHLVAGLLDASAAITLRRDMLATIHHKFPAQVGDDLHWPLLEVKEMQHPVPQTHAPNVSSEEDPHSEEGLLREYWNSLQTRYQKCAVDVSHLSTSQMIGLPSNWTAINISVTDDKTMLFIARQEGGESHREPLIFCIPLKGRRDNGSGEDEEENLTFDDAMEEFRNIVRLSDEGTRAAVHIKEDQEARTVWWKQRGELNTRMRELLENIEYCWLGAFKTICSPRPCLTPGLISALRSQFEKVFQRNLHVKDNKPKSRPEKHKKSAAQIQNQAPSQVTFDDSLLECFSTLSPKCRDEELEDLVYFILDLYQFHGVPVAIAEVDIVQVVVDLRGVLEDHALRLSQMEPWKDRQKADEEHTFLILDKNLQCLPWESIPILKGRSISRIPSIDFLHDRISLAKMKGQSITQHDVLTDRAAIDPRRGYYILNPSGDLHRTEERFRAWAAEMKEVGWEGIIGHAPSEQQFLHALQNQDLVVYFGHGGGEQYVRSHKIRSLPSCAATMLWGCSSGALRDMGDFDRTGTPYTYMLAGCPTLVANLWDVTDRDIDLFSQSVFDKLRLTAGGVKKWVGGQHTSNVSVVEAVAQSRGSCKLEYLTGAAPVVYGIPFYL